MILALDLYYDLESGQMNSSNPEIIKLSELLNRLPIHINRPDQEKFRNPNGVNLKLGNFNMILTMQVKDCRVVVNLTRLY